MRKLLRTGAGVVCGYALMVVLITLVQDAWLGGVGWDTTPLGVLAVAGFLTCVAAAIGGVVGTVIAHPTGRTAAVVMSCFVVVETTFLILRGKVAGPLWFDIVAAASLIVAILVGAEVYLLLKGRAGRQPAQKNL